MTEHHERETVVVERDRGSGLGTILSIVVVITLLIAGWWFLIGPGSGGRGGSPNPGAGDTNTTTPSEVAPSEAASDAPAGS